jgi:hypothetical protein
MMAKSDAISAELVRWFPMAGATDDGWHTFECAPLDGTPVIFMHRDGSGAFMVFFAAGAWWEASEHSDCTWPWSHQDDLIRGGDFWCHVPPSLRDRADKFCADQREWIINNHGHPAT